MNDLGFYKMCTLPPLTFLEANKIVKKKDTKSAQ